jgi:hypothetical protein
MTNILMTIALLIGIFKAVKEVVEAVEVPGNGEAKRTAVLEAVGAIYDAIPGSLPIARDAVLEFAGKVLEVWVVLNNLIGKFKKATPTANPTQGV